MHDIDLIYVGNDFYTVHFKFMFIVNGVSNINIQEI